MILMLNFVFNPIIFQIPPQKYSIFLIRANIFAFFAYFSYIILNLHKNLQVRIFICTFAANL